MVKKLDLVGSMVDFSGHTILEKINEVIDELNRIKEKIGLLKEKEKKKIIVEFKEDAHLGLIQDCRTRIAESALFGAEDFIETTKIEGVFKK